MKKESNQSVVEACVKLLRPHQWLKNFFVFLPLFFGRQLLNISALQDAFVVFCSFCMMASAIYCLNDIIDAEADRRHPNKKKRPIASGVVPKPTAYTISAACVLMSLMLLMMLNEDKMWKTVCVLVFYFILNVAYCFHLKNHAIVDVFIIAFGFVLRVLSGGFSTKIALSHWIILMTFLIALFLAFCKRRDDIVQYENTGELMRKNIKMYNMTFLNLAITIVSTLTMVCYIMYSVSNDVMQLFSSHYVFLTSLFVLAGIIKYLQITIVDQKSGSPTKVLMKSRFIQACLFCWFLSFIIIIYL